MMTLDEAIKHAEEVAEQSEEDAKEWIREGWQSVFKDLQPEKEAEFYTVRKKLSDGCEKCAEEHRQLAEWLKELKVIREQKRPHGKWTEEFDENANPFFQRRWRCSACNDYNCYGRTEFCPHCGADMRKEGDEE